MGCFGGLGRYIFHFLNNFELPVTVTAHALGTHTEDGQNGGNTRQCMNKTVLAALNEHQL